MYYVQVFGRRHDEAIHALRRPKSAKAGNRGFGTAVVLRNYGDFAAGADWAW
jgi:hypothetical protein